jgi:ribosomal protein S18 acetylase RimI-like enzyme
MSNITIRDINESDVDKIKTIIKNIWEWDSLADTQELMDAIISIYFNPVLHTSTFIRVAELDNYIAGIICGVIENEAPKYRNIMEDLSSHALTIAGASEINRASIREYFLKERDAYQQLVVNCAHEYDGRLEFLILDTKAQGLGIGKKLWLELKKYFVKNNVKNIYLYTDNESNYNFYESQGFIRNDEINVVYTFGDFIWENTTYLYGYRFDTDSANQ